MAFGKYYEKFEVDQAFKHWPGRTISKADDTWFSPSTINQNPLHIDTYHAEHLQHGQHSVVGTPVFSTVASVSVADISGGNRKSGAQRNQTHQASFSWRHDLR